MLVESIAILLILLLIGGVFLRSGRKDYLLMILPLALVPLVHSVLVLLGEGFTFATYAHVRAFSDVLALAVSVAVMGLLSAAVKSRRARTAYLVICGGFSTLLTLIYLYNIYQL